jgi:hypothetical protein
MEYSAPGVMKAVRDALSAKLSAPSQAAMRVMHPGGAVHRPSGFLARPAEPDAGYEGGPKILSLGTVGCRLCAGPGEQQF